MSRKGAHRKRMRQNGSGRPFLGIPLLLVVPGLTLAGFGILGLVSYATRDPNAHAVTSARQLPAAEPSGTSSAVPVGAAPTRVPPLPGAAAATPVRIEVPAVHLDVPVTAVGTDREGALAVPTDFGQAGWWRSGPVPGNVGPAVIVGHYDSKTGPGAFYPLGLVGKNARITVTRSDRRTLSFVVDRIDEVRKNTFPTRAVYGPTPDAQLRLITCAGDFNRATGHYESNLIIFAHLSPAAARPTRRNGPKPE